MTTASKPAARKKRSTKPKGGAQKKPRRTTKPLPNQRGAKKQRGQGESRPGPWWPPQWWPWGNKDSGGSNRRRKKDKPREPRTKKQIALAIAKWGAISGLAMLALFASTIAILFWMYGKDVQSVDQLRNYTPNQVVKITTSNDQVIGELFEERRTFIAFKDVPKHVWGAFVSAEDSKFFSHKGIDYTGMVRALIANVKSGRKKQGASTITQQVVKTFLLTPERTFKRKFQEIILARRLENKLSKEEILTLYLNQIYFGHGRYGLVEAAQFYFGKPVKKLDVGEAALLASLPQSPERLSPRKPRNRRRVSRRQRYVLGQMAANGYISSDEAKVWAKRKIEVLRNPYPKMNVAPEWVDEVRRTLAERYNDDELNKLGVNVETTIDLRMQRDALRALRKGLHQVDKRQGYGRAIRRVRKDKIKLAIAKLARKLPDGGPKAKTVYQAVVVAVHDKPGELVVDLGNYKASIILNDDYDARYNAKGEKPGQRFKVGSVVKVKRAGPKSVARRPPDHSDRVVDMAPGPQGAIVVMDPKTRKVLAMVGGYDNRVGDFNRATMAKRQPGSSFKPFVYAAAIEAGDFHPAFVVNDAPEVYNLWRPKNYTSKFAGPVRLRHALAKSINTVAIHVANKVGPEQVAELANRMGVQSKLPTTLSLALGSGEVTPLEMTNAFATFVAGGRSAPPRLILSVGGKQEPIAKSQQAIKPETAYVVTDMMKSVTTYGGTAWRLAKLRMEVAGKTGTSNDARDAWFMAVTPKLVIGVWVGFDDNSPLGKREGGGKSAAPVTAEFLKLTKAHRTMARIGRRFVRPSNIETARIDKESGKLSAKGAPRKTSYVEVFVKGTVPTEFAVAPGQDREDGFVTDEYDDDDSGGDKKPISGKEAGDKATPKKKAKPPDKPATVP